MSDKSESFNEWWEMFELHCVSSDETIKVIEIVESAWKHQQKKIDELEQKLQAAEEEIKEMDTFIRSMITSDKNGHSFHAGGWGIDCGDEDCMGCYWQKQYIEKVRKG